MVIGGKPFYWPRLTWRMPLTFEFQTCAVLALGMLASLVTTRDCTHIAPSTQESYIDVGGTGLAVMHA
ncbi:hypothetical protein VTO73DRAFT_15084 [Trametes versicolor]